MQMNMPPSIVVGIANVDRKRDFTFHTDLEEFKKAYSTQCFWLFRLFSAKE
jgi:hypothetical protein